MSLSGQRRPGGPAGGGRDSCQKYSRHDRQQRYTYADSVATHYYSSTKSLQTWGRKRCTLISRRPCHSWRNPPALEGHERPVHSQHLQIKDVRGINAAWPFADIIRVSGYIKIEISCRATECAESGNGGRTPIRIKVVRASL